MFRTFLSAALAVTLFACGTQPAVDPTQPDFTVDPSLTPAVTSAPDDTGAMRAVGRFDGPSHTPVDFVLDEVLVAAATRAEADAVAARWNGSVLSEAPLSTDHGSLFRLRVDPSKADVTALPAHLESLTPASHGTHTASSDRALQLLALATEEADVHGTVIGLDFLFQPAGIADGHTTDGAGVDVFAETAIERHQVNKAWQVLKAAGRLTPQVTALIMDSGFVQNPDLPADTVLYPGPQAWGQPNDWGCGGGSCPWHGTDVAEAFAGQLDNGFGAAGPAGPVTKRLVLAKSPAADLWQILEYVFVTLPKALSEKPRIINISATFEVPGFFGFLCKPVEWAVSDLRHGGTLLFAAAGNAGKDVDDEDCFVACWESSVYVPCELDDVVCVGGVDSATTKAPNSNWGHNQRGAKAYASAVAGDNSVDLYGPYTVLVGLPRDARGAATSDAPRLQNGTSFASPFVAGIAALVWAANPELSADEVVTRLVDSAQGFGGAGSPRNDDRGRMVNAYASVKPVLGNLAPSITITAPADGATILVNPQGVTFTADTFDWEDGTAEVTWSSNVDGVLGTGPTVTHEFATLGPRVIHATARDTQGATRTASMSITIENTPPQGDITSPAAGAQLTVAVPFQLTANTGYAGNTFRTLTCTWTSSDAGDSDFPKTGCATTARIASVGPRTLTLELADQYGTTTVSTVMVTGVPAGPALVPVILSPANLGYAAVNDLLTLNGTWSGGQAPFSYVWRWQAAAAGCPEVDLVTTGATSAPPSAGPAFRLWDTATVLNVANGCGYGDGEVRLFVTDANAQTASASVTFRLNYQPGPR